MRLSIFETTHQGSRKNNQDYFAHKFSKTWGCFVVADGLGGHPKGELISSTFCECLLKEVDNFASKFILDPINQMEELILKAHQVMCAEIIHQFGVIDCHTTFAFLWIDDKNLITAHVGDSRIYRMDSHNIIWRTPDHTMVQKIFEAGEITEEAFATHPLQNRLTRTVNLFEAPSPDIFVHSPLENDELIVLCTDGFWTHLVAGDWRSLFYAEDKGKRAQELVDKIAREHAVDADNITVQLIYKEW